MKALKCHSDARLAGTRSAIKEQKWSRHVLANVQDEPRPGLARLVLLGARGVTTPVAGSGALLGIFLLPNFENSVGRLFAVCHLIRVAQ